MRHFYNRIITITAAQHTIDINSVCGVRISVDSTKLQKTNECAVFRRVQSVLSENPFDVQSALVFETIHKHPLRPTNGPIVFESLTLKKGKLELNKCIAYFLLNFKCCMDHNEAEHENR